MSNRLRDDSGRFTEKVTDQDLLTTFDFEATDEDPYLTVREVTDALATHWDINVTDEAVPNRLDAMVDAEQIVRRTVSRNAVGVSRTRGAAALQGSPAEVDAVGDHEDQDETVSLAEMTGESDME